MKYYAKEEKPGYIEVERYFPEQDAIEQNIYIGGNFSYDTINDSLLAPIQDKVEELISLIEEKESVFRRAHKKIHLTITDYSEMINSLFQKENYEEFTGDDIWAIRFGVEELRKKHSFETELRVYSAIIGAVKGEDFTYDILRGTSSEEYTGCIYPKTVPYKEIEMIENVFFAKIKEFEITTEPIESKEEFENVLRVFWANLQNEYDVKKAIARFLGCSESEVEIFKTEEQEE